MQYRNKNIRTNLATIMKRPKPFLFIKSLLWKYYVLWIKLRSGIFKVIILYKIHIKTCNIHEISKPKHNKLQPALAPTPHVAWRTVARARCPRHMYGPINLIRARAAAYDDPCTIQLYDNGRVKNTPYFGWLIQPALSRIKALIHYSHAQPICIFNRVH